MIEKKIKNIIILLLSIYIVAVSSVSAQSNQYSEISSRPGAFSRMGFGARGMGMGNAMSAVNHGDVVAYYNPALSVFQEDNSFQTSYSILSLDRKLNFLSFTRKFEFGKKKNDKPLTKHKGVAGISVGIINASVGNFQERDNQGNVTGELSPYENQFFIGLANRFSEKLSLGFNAKFYYSKLYDEITTTTLGIDIGALYLLNENITISGMLTDLVSKYQWNTTPIYDQEGYNTADKFPLLKKIGVSYKFDNPNLIAALEFENSDAGTNYLRFGLEYNIFEGLFIRGGLDKFNLSNTDAPSRPSLGFSSFHDFSTLLLGINYAFVAEPYSSSDRHIIGIDINF